MMGMEELVVGRVGAPCLVYVVVGLSAQLLFFFYDRYETDFPRFHSFLLIRLYDYKKWVVYDEILH